MMPSLRALCLPAALFAFAAPAFAQGSDAEITALGRTELRHDWLSLHAPDSQGTITVRISTADLDLNTPAGQAALDRRIAHAKSDMCRAALADPDVPSVGLGAERACLRAARVRSDASRQAAR